MHKISVIILNYKGAANTIACLKSFHKIEIPEGYTLEPIIVDNASHDGSVEVFKKEFPKITLIENKVNTGYAGGNNTGIAYALKHNASHIVIMNNDTIITPSLFLELYNALMVHRADVACPKIYFEKGFEFHKDRYKEDELGKVFWFAGAQMDWNNIIGHHRGVDEVDRGQYDEKTAIEGITGACFMAKQEVFEKIGMFNEKFFLYYEDADLSFRMKKAGFKIILASQAILYHKNAGSTGGSGSPLQDYFIARNRLFFGMKYARLRTRLALFRESFRVLLSGRPWQKRGVMDFYFKKMGKGSYPLP
ncbi:MAG: glycosyltransferase family 2 protein [Candidatus Levyibacteriota bacterium]